MASPSDPHHRPRPPARRVSRRRYRVRRVGALVVLVAAGAGLQQVGGALFGADGTEADGVDTTLAAPDDSAAVDGSTLATTPGVTTADTSAAPATVDDTPTVPTPDDPATVLIAGDSDAGTFGSYLDTLLDETGVASTTLDYKVSSGLARPDFFDWPAHFREQIPVVDPDIVVVTFGGNDAQGLSDQSGTFIHQQPTGDEGGDVEWRAEYGRRVGEVMDYLASEGRTLVWVGIPNDDNPDVTARMRVQDEVVRAEVAKRPHVHFVDTWARFSGREGNWAEYVIDPRDGQGKDVRADDGFHLNTTGAEILALDIAEVVRQELRNRGATF